MAGAMGRISSSIKIDNVIDATPYFFDENKAQQMSERRVGMGSIGLAVFAAVM